MKRLYRFLSMVLLLLMMPAAICPHAAYADEEATTVSGHVYVLEDNDGKFDYSKAKSETSSSDNTYGSFSLIGDINKVDDKDGFAAFDAEGTVDEATGEDQSEVRFLYAYDDDLLNADDSKEWALYSDNSKKIGDIELDDKVGNGAIVVQSSFDGKNWCTDQISVDLFEKNAKNSSDTFYTTKTNQLVNGCYYRVTVAYETSLLIKSQGVI